MNFVLSCEANGGKRENLNQNQQHCRNLLKFDHTAVQHASIMGHELCVSLNIKDPHSSKDRNCISSFFKSLDGIWYLLAFQAFCVPGGKNARSLETIIIVCLWMFALLYR